MSKMDMALEAYDAEQPKFQMGDEAKYGEGLECEVLDVMMSLRDGGIFYYIQDKDTGEQMTKSASKLSE